MTVETVGSTNHAEESIRQIGDGPKVAIFMPKETVERAASAIHRSGIVTGFAIAASVVMSIFFARYLAVSEYQTLQFNLLRSCLQSAQCDVQKVMDQLNKEK